MNETLASLDLVVSDQADGQPQSIDYTFDTYKLYIIDNSQEALEHLLLVALVYIVVCLGVYLLICRRQRSIPVNLMNFPICKRVLIVTAHPDDECMFFGPTILSLTHRNDCRVFLMCLSNGLL